MDHRYNLWLDAEEALDARGADQATRDAVFDAIVGQQQRTLDRIGVVGLVNSAVKSAGGQASFARYVRVSQSHLSLMLHGHREFNDQVLTAAGIRRTKLEIERFEPIGVTS